MERILKFRPGQVRKRKIFCQQAFSDAILPKFDGLLFDFIDDGLDQRKVIYQYKRLLRKVV